MICQQDCKLGMRVYFGRPNGEKTLGEITKLNFAKAKVKTLEERGSRSPAGAVWSVPYSMLYPTGVNGHSPVTVAAKTPASADATALATLRKLVISAYNASTSGVELEGILDDMCSILGITNDDLDVD